VQRAEHIISWQPKAVGSQPVSSHFPNSRYRSLCIEKGGVKTPPFIFSNALYQ
jgi:hypothetical protein